MQLPSPLSVNETLVPDASTAFSTVVPPVSLPAASLVAYRFSVTVAPLSHVTVPEMLFTVLPEMFTPGAAGFVRNVAT